MTSVCVMNSSDCGPPSFDYGPGGQGLVAGGVAGGVAVDSNWSLDLAANWSLNASDGPEWTHWTDLARERSALAVLLLLFSIATVFGNALVVAAVVRERYLHTATNYFVTSLAVADCLVGLVVMPFSAIYEVVENQWFFGMDWCDVWRSLDVLFSTASILNLCVISLDRYWAITDPFTYPTKMTRRRAAMLIGMVWICSGGISFPAIVWWRAVRAEELPPLKCPFTDSLTYLFFSSTISFYLPLFVMVFTYYRIYRAAVIQTRSLKLGSKQVMMASGELELTLRIHRGGTGSSGGSQASDRQSGQGLPLHGSSPATAPSATTTPEELPDIEDPLTPHNGLSRSGARIVNNKNLGKNFSISRKLAKFAKEKKAAKTLGIVMGVFIVCWLPFFVVNLLSGICPSCIVHEQLVSAVVTWLGWINSGMNPVIYACWSRDFRRIVDTVIMALCFVSLAFARILCVCCPRKVRRKYQPTLRCKPSTRAYSSSHGGTDANLTHRDTLAPISRHRLCSGYCSARDTKRAHKYLNAAVMLTPTGVTYASVHQHDVYGI